MKASALVVIGVALSLGRFPSATARLTYDRRKAEAGGYVYALARAEQADDEAIRVSEAVLVVSGGPASHAAVVARSHGVPAMLLPGAVWRKDGLSLLEPRLGPERVVDGVAVRVVESSAERALPEGAVVSVDPERATLSVPPEDQQEEALAFAEAIRGYEGLRDPQALLHWWSARPPAAGASLAPRLYAEAAALIADGLVAPGDASVLAKAWGDKAEAARAAREQRRRWEAAAAELKASLAAAGTAEAVDRLESDAEKRYAGVAALCAASGLPPPSPAVSALESLARARRSTLAKAGPLSLADAARAAGARAQEVERVEPALYARFVSENGLAPLIDEVSQDASLRLAQKSDRIAALFSAAKVGTALGEELRKRCPQGGPLRVVGEDVALDGVTCEGFADALRRVWASSWAPGPLGARKRAGQGAPAPVVTATREPGDVGTLYSRDPAGGRRRALVSWLGGEYALSPSGRLLAPPAAPAERRLSAARLEKLSRLARALDAYFGAGAQAAFAFSASGDLVLIDAQALPTGR